MAVPLAYVQEPFHTFVAMALKKEEFLVAVKGKETALRRRESNGFHFARRDVSVDHQAGRRLFHDEVMRRNDREAIENQLYWFTHFDLQMIRRVRITIDRYGDTLNAITIKGYDDGRRGFEDFSEGGRDKQAHAEDNEDPFKEWFSHRPFYQMEFSPSIAGLRLALTWR